MWLSSRFSSVLENKGFSPRKKKWLRNDIDVKDDPYKTPTLAYNREMDQLMVADIVNIKVEGENIKGPVTKKKMKG